MAWWAWLIIGLFLMGAELLGVDAAFYLIFLGSAGLAVGLLGMVGLDLPVWGQWLLFSILAISSMVLFRRKLYDRYRGGLPGFGDTRINEIVEVSETIDPGHTGRVSLRGSSWTAENVGENTMAPGEKARIIEAKGMTLKIRQMSE